MNGKDGIAWDKSFETGVEEIDEQHRILVNTIKEAEERLTEDASLETLETITKDLLSYALYHFETEEVLMQEHDYKGYSQNDYEQHMKQHRDFSAKVVAIRDQIKTGHPIEKEKLIGFLTDWLINHINNTDKKLGRFLEEAK
ncbi:MAG: bacteriohemerythrin [Sulfurimonadaceae bacterium]|nr:bacteriohemerythrin [Sulfurimonadaceae bacterium]